MEVNAGRIRPNRTDRNHVWICSGVGQARIAAKLIKTIACSCADQNVLGADGLQFITETVMA